MRAFLPERDYVTFRYFPSQFRLSVVSLSVTSVNPNWPLEIYDNISTPFCSIVIG